MDTEVEIAEVLIRHLADPEHGRYIAPVRFHHEPKVVIAGQSYPVDLVAVVPMENPAFQPTLHAYEVKKSLTPGLIDQVARVAPYAEEAWAVVEEPKSISPAHRHRKEILRRFGYGLIYVQPHTITFMLLPTERRRRLDDRLLEACVHDQTTGAIPAGSRGGKRIVADQWEKVRAFLRARPGLSGKELEQEGLLSHAERAKFTTAAWNGKIRGILCQRSTIPARFYVEE